MGLTVMRNSLVFKMRGVGLRFQVVSLLGICIKKHCQVNAQGSSMVAILPLLAIGRAFRALVEVCLTAPPEETPLGFATFTFFLAPCSR